MTIELDPGALRALADRQRYAAEQLTAIVTLVRSTRNRTLVDSADGDVVRAAPMTQLVDVERSMSQAGGAMSSRATRLSMLAATADGLDTPGGIGTPGGIENVALAVGGFLIDQVGDLVGEGNETADDLAEAWSSAGDAIDSLMATFGTDISPFRSVAPSVPTGSVTHVSEETQHIDLSIFATASVDVTTTVDRAADGSLVVTVSILGGVGYEPGEGASVRFGPTLVADQARAEAGVVGRQVLTYVFADDAEYVAWQRHVVGQLAAAGPLDFATRGYDSIFTDAAGPATSNYVGAGVTAGAHVALGELFNAEVGVELRAIAEHDLIGHTDQISFSSTLDGSVGVGAGLVAVSATRSIAFDGTVQIEHGSPTAVTGIASVEVGPSSPMKPVLDLLGVDSAGAVLAGLAAGKRYRIETVVSGTVTTSSLAEFLRHPISSETSTTTAYEVHDDSTEIGGSVELEEFGQLGAGYESHSRTLTPLPH